MGSKYKASIKDLKATLRFHRNAGRSEANGPVKKSIYMTARPSLGKAGEIGTNIRVSEPQTPE